MMEHKLDITTLLNIPIWEQVQDQLAKYTGMAMTVVDAKGLPVIKSSGQREFCRLMHENPVTRKRCIRCDALAGLEAMRMERPYIYLCHCGVVDVAVPVTVDDRYLGAVLFGQVRVPNEDTNVKLKRLVSDYSTFCDGDENACAELVKLFEAIPVVDYRRIEETAELVSTIVNSVVKRSVESIGSAQEAEWLQSIDDSQNNSEVGIQEFIRPAAQAEFKDEPIRISENSVIYPALRYISEHLDESITMKEMAALCHLSPSYFSRLFGRELGENFVSYVNRKKVQKAKFILRHTNKSVSQIASELSYQDSSHFINLFKRFEGITPQVYRQYNYR